MTMTLDLSPTRSHRGDRVLAVCLALAFCSLCALFWPFTADDAYIVGRYALNAAAGEGLVYNPGERVSALTSPLHALLETGFAVLGLDPVGAYRAISPALVLLGWLVALRETSLTGHRLVLFSAIALFSPFLALWTVGGLETPILTCLATCFAARLLRLLREERAADSDLYWLGGLAALMFLTRHDSVLVSAPILLAIAVVEARRPALWAAATFCTALAASWLVFAQFYYGDILPTSYHVKFGSGGRRVIDSVATLANFALLSGLGGLAFFARPRNRTGGPALPRAIRAGSVIAAALFLAYATRASGQHMMFGYRLFVPYLMPAALVLVTAIPALRRGLAPVVLAAQTAMVALVLNTGVNPAPLSVLPGLNTAFVEYRRITPASFGQWRMMLVEDARAISAHWTASGQTERPRIYLRSGGMGYFMPGFYVYESLVSYRHACGVPTRAMIDASHYVQQLGFSLTGSLVEDRGRAREDIADDAPLLWASEIDWDRPNVTGYLYGPDPHGLSLGDRVDAPCSLAPRSGRAG